MADLYRLSPLAVADLEDIYVYTLQTWSVEQAITYHGSLVATFEGLADRTRIGRTVDIYADYLKYLTGSHVVYYRLSDGAVEIIRILHQSMDVGRHLKP